MNIKIYENHKLIAEYQNAKKFYLNDFSELVVIADNQETKTHKLNLATTDFEVVND